MAHVFLAVALALPLVAAVAAITVALVNPAQSSLNRGLLIALGGAFAAMVVWVALVPEVRPVEVATARTLLGLDLPEVTRPEDWGSRRRGALWLAILALVGLLVAGGLLYLLPTGVGLLAHPFTGAEELRRPGGYGTFWTGSGWRASWLVVPGLVALAASAGLVWGAGVVITRLAPRIIGPTVVERVAVAAHRERELARANALARDLHDTLGHRLTAMTVQATAARRLLRTDPEAAERALAAVEDLGRSAQADVDDVVGALRGRTPDPGSAPGTHPARSENVDARPARADVVAALRPLIAQHPTRLDVAAPARLDVTAGTADTIFRVAQEALTNATRHGSGTADLRLRSDSDDVVLEVRNAVAAQAKQPVSTDRSGLQGLRERVLLDGGTFTAGREEEGTWLVQARLPIR